MKRATIYARVSTKDQNIEGQLIDLREYAQARGLKVTKEYRIRKQG
jgi:DNA invertase Pin-like site-specific DNA recombinase